MPLLLTSNNQFGIIHSSLKATWVYGLCESRRKRLL